MAIEWNEAKERPIKTSVTTYYLEMTRLGQLSPSETSGETELVVRQAKIPSPVLSRFLYTAVGGEWYWIDRLEWTYEGWLAYLDRPELQTWIGYTEDTPAGYFELERQPARHVEIAYFGLLPQFIGRGLGGRLLTRAVEQAWAMDAGRVWVHTCTLDGPNALANYLARGFRIYREEQCEVVLPDHADALTHSLPPLSRSVREGRAGEG